MGLAAKSSGLKISLFFWWAIIHRPWVVKQIITGCNLMTFFSSFGHNLNTFLRPTIQSGCKLPIPPPSPMLVREMERVSSIPKTKIHHFLTKCLMKKKIVMCVDIAHAVSHIKTISLGTVKETLTYYKKEGIVFLQRIITIDETWVRNFKPELKSRSKV